MLEMHDISILVFPFSLSDSIISGLIYGKVIRPSCSSLQVMRYYQCAVPKTGCAQSASEESRCFLLPGDGDLVTCL